MDEYYFDEKFKINRFFDNRKNSNKHKQYNFIDNEIVLNNLDKYIIRECQEACKKLWDKNIEIFKTSNYNDHSLFILLAELSQENKARIENVIDNSKFFYDNEYERYGIRVNGINEEASYELANLTDIFVIQDTYRYTSAVDFVEQYKYEHPFESDLNMFDIIKKTGKEHLYIPSEGKIYKSKMYLDWHKRYEKMLNIRSKASISFMNLNENNINNDVSFIRDTYLEIEKEYILELAKDYNFSSVIKFANNLTIDELTKLANDLIEQVELDQFNEKQMELVEKKLIVYFAAIKDKVFKKGSKNKVFESEEKQRCR